MATVQSLWGAIVLALTLLGVGGTLYNLLAPDGWIAWLFGRDAAGAMAVVGSLGLLLVYMWWSRDFSPRHRNRYAGLFVYGFSAAGLVYLGRFWTSGGF